LENAVEIQVPQVRQEFGAFLSSRRHVQVIAPGQLKTAQKIGFDTAGRLRQSVVELTARFPPFDLRKISASYGGNNSILNQSGRPASNA